MVDDLGDVLKENDDLSFLSKFEDPVEKAKRLSHDPNFLKEYEEQQVMDKNNRLVRLIQNRFIFSNPYEVSRREFLPKLSSVELDNLANIVHHIAVTGYENQLPEVGILGIGTAVYNEAYWNNLKKLFAIPHAKFLQIEGAPIWDKDHKVVGSFDPLEVLADKGADIDIMVVRDDMYEHLTSDDFVKYLPTLTKRLQKENISISLTNSKDGCPSKTNYDVFQFEGASVPTVYREKQVDHGRFAETIIASFKEGRDIHIYFDSTHMDEKLRYERLCQDPFSILSRHGDCFDLVDAIKNGQKTGVYEHPLLVDYAKEHNVPLDTYRLR